MFSLLPRRIRTFRRITMALFFTAFAFTFIEHLRDAAKLRAVHDSGFSRWTMYMASSRIPGVSEYIHEKQQPPPPVTVTQFQTVWTQVSASPRATFGARDAYASPGQQAQDPLSTPSPLQQHIYRSDGLLEVNPEGPHPVFELIQKAEADWEAKLNRASKTLPEAVIEYENRYKRSPPLGFDKWWGYVVQHNVQLPDEYDQIYQDLEPFWGMNPTDLQSLVTEWEYHDDTYTIGKQTQDAPIMLVNWSLPGQDKAGFDLAGGAYEIMDVLEDVEEHIPPFRAVVSPHDNPNLPTDWELRRMAIRHAELGTFLDFKNPPPAKLDGWLSGCDPSTPARHTPIDWSRRGGIPPSSSPSNKSKTFIYNHLKSMNPCLHPSLFLLHGQFLSHNKGPVPHRRIVPQFSYSPTLVHHDITLAMPINWIEDLYGEEGDKNGDNPKWEDRWDERLLWRGSNTGMWHAEGTRWRDAQRDRLAELAAVGEGDMTVLMPPPRPFNSSGEVDMNVKQGKVGPGVQVKKARLAPALLDVALAGQPGSCDQEKGFCEELKKEFEFKRSMSLKEAGKYKYVLDVDGNAWSSRFKRLITSNALVFKSTIYPEWFGDRVAPWVHYIPVQVDYSDLYDSLLFFRGDLNGNGGHDDLARKIGAVGRQWSLKFWRKEDLTAYMFRLLLEYARVMSPDRLSMNYVPPHT